MDTLSRALLLTSIYAAQFSYPLTTRELLLRLVGVQTFTGAQLISSLKWLRSQRLLEYGAKYWVLCGQQNTVTTRGVRHRSTEQKLQEILPLRALVEKIPWICGFAITGSAAVANADSDADVDFLVVTEDNRLWLVRPLLILFAFLYGKRRTWAREEKDSWCFNLWLERSQLRQQKQTHSLYLAHEVCQANWLLSRQNCQRQFLQANQWVAQYLPRYYRENLSHEAEVERVSPVQHLPFVREFWTVLNTVLFILQRIYMQHHMTRERVSLHLAYFHPRDTRRVISRGIHAIVERLHG